MSDQFRDKPSKWLMYNSMGYPDFLFTILTYAMALLAMMAVVWLTFSVVAFTNAGSPHATVSLAVLENMQSGFISMVGVIFSLAGSYVVRRYKKDEHYVEKKQMDHEIEMMERTVEPTPPIASTMPIAERGLGLVMNEEDI
ncbi:MAG: hypothetical protein ACRBF0_07850 [Calditrichia bacterium]